MTITIHSVEDGSVAEISSDEMLITCAADGLELLGNLYYQNIDRVILHAKDLTPDFFDLKNGMAGEILQKFSNYHVTLSVVGDFSKYEKQSTRDFIRECNSGNQVSFVATTEDAIQMLTVRK